MRKGLLWAGVMTLVASVVIFAVCAFESSQAANQLFSCQPSNPYNAPLPPECMSALGTMILFGMLQWVGIIGGVVGFVVLILGLLLQPEQPTMAPPPYYAPQYYPPPPVYPPQGPQTPPPQP